MTSTAKPADVEMTDAAQDKGVKKSITPKDNKDLKTAADSQKSNDEKSNKPDEEIESDGPDEAPKSTKEAKTS